MKFEKILFPIDSEIVSSRILSVYDHMKQKVGRARPGTNSSVGCGGWIRYVWVQRLSALFRLTAIIRYCSLPDWQRTPIRFSVGSDRIGSGGCAAALNSADLPLSCLTVTVNRCSYVHIERQFKVF